MNKILSALLLFTTMMLAISCCKSNQHNASIANANQSEDTTKSSDSKVDIEAPSEKVILNLISCIPDHGISDSPKWAFTTEYYDLLTEAWDIPDDAPPGMIGSNEWLFYFISGNSGETPHFKNITTTMKDSTAIIDFDALEHHQMKLQFRDGKWIISDFDNTKSELRKYIREQRAYFRSQWKKDLQGFDLSAEEKAQAQKEVDRYFRLYPDKK